MSKKRKQIRPRLPQELTPEISWLKTLPIDEQIDLGRKAIKWAQKNVGKNPQSCYLVKCAHLYKIGTSKNVERRFKEIRALNPIAELVCFSDRVGEGFLHAYFESRHYENEWYQLSAKDVNLIMRLMGEI